jgi:ABC-type phosphate transport system substrate-binding protein
MRVRATLTFLLLLALWSRGSGAISPDAAQSHRPEQSGPFEPLAIVVNHTNPSDNLSMAELRKIFLGERSHWANGRRITIVMRDLGEPERRIIVRDVCGMTEDQLKFHVLHGLFTGEILVSPKILSSPEGVRKFVFNVPGAIGYLRMSDVDSTVKVVAVDNLLPGERDYRLRVPIQTGY